MLSLLKTDIENMAVQHQIEVLRILRERSYIPLNENNNGTFVNLTKLSHKDVTLLRDYCDYVNQQQNTITSVEDEKKYIQDTYFKPNKDTTIK
jgi:hypothetical protein